MMTQQSRAIVAAAFAMLAWAGGLTTIWSAIRGDGFFGIAVVLYFSAFCIGVAVYQAAMLAAPAPTT
jgi:hypothetical protein